jgi:hypothetical protein
MVICGHGGNVAHGIRRNCSPRDFNRHSRRVTNPCQGDTPLNAEMIVERTIRCSHAQRRHVMSKCFIVQSRIASQRRERRSEYPCRDVESIGCRHVRTRFRTLSALKVACYGLLSALVWHSKRLSAPYAAATRRELCDDLSHPRDRSQ